MRSKATYCQNCGVYNEDGFKYCTRCGGGFASPKDSNKLLWIILLLFLGLPLLTMLIAFILYVMVMGFG
ncbi:MAG: hypothetical protein LUQ39_08975 [Methanomassiliicoccales archaeon]|nr:hypothetical protein [Methanomassiliicoccales archaeon]